MNILFVHAGIGQFLGIHEYINEHTDSSSWLLCSQEVYNAFNATTPNLIPFVDAQENPDTYFYVKDLEARIQRSFLIRAAVLDLLKSQQIDVIVAHSIGGFPLQMYDDPDIAVPIVSYIEFPSFKAYGHDPKYPPPEASVYLDKVFEMYHHHQLVRSQAVIVPSQHTKDMLPPAHHPKVHVRMEGVKTRSASESDPSRRRATPPTRPGRPSAEFRIGFLARDLSSAKGVEHFIMAAKQIHRRRPQTRFLICGSKDMRYSYEDVFLANLIAAKEIPEGTKFLDYLFLREGIDPADGVFEHVEFMDYDEFGRFVDGLDLVHYPLQCGSANWGLFELLFRGKVVVGSDRGFVPEVITDGYNGLVCGYGNIDAWTRQTVEIVDDPRAYDRLGDNARADMDRRFHVSVAAEGYLSILERVIGDYRAYGPA